MGNSKGTMGPSESSRAGDAIFGCPSMTSHPDGMSRQDGHARLPRFRHQSLGDMLFTSTPVWKNTLAIYGRSPAVFGSVHGLDLDDYVVFGAQ